MTKKLKSPFALHGAQDASTLFNAPKGNSETIITHDDTENLQEHDEDLDGNILLSEPNPRLASDLSVQNEKKAEDGEEEEDPPLLEDLGINFDNIKSKFVSVLTFKSSSEELVGESDMAGPLLLAFAFGTFLMMSGKIHFGYIYGFGLCGCLLIYLLMNLISQDKYVEFYYTMSILGYCLIPIVILSALNVVLTLKGMMGFPLSTVCVIWATTRASYFFRTFMDSPDKRMIVSYPILLYYTTFILITIF